jgi:hypothetical protein
LTLKPVDIKPGKTSDVKMGNSSQKNAMERRELISAQRHTCTQLKRTNIDINLYEAERTVLLTEDIVAMIVSDIVQVVRISNNVVVTSFSFKENLDSFTSAKYSVQTIPRNFEYFIVTVTKTTEYRENSPYHKYSYWLCNYVNNKKKPLKSAPKALADYFLFTSTKPYQPWKEYEVYDLAKERTIHTLTPQFHAWHILLGYNGKIIIASTSDIGNKHIRTYDIYTQQYTEYSLECLEGLDQKLKVLNETHVAIYNAESSRDPVTICIWNYKSGTTDQVVSLNTIRLYNSVGLCPLSQNHVIRWYGSYKSDGKCLRARVRTFTVEVWN